MDIKIPGFKKFSCKKRNIIYYFGSILQSFGLTEGGITKWFHELGKAIYRMLICGLDIEEWVQQVDLKEGALMAEKIAHVSYG